MAKKSLHQLAYRAIRIEGGLIPAEELTRLTLLADPKASEQTESHYRIARGLKLRDEIARDFKIALNLWQDFQSLRKRQDVQAHDVTVREWLLPLLRDVLHFHDASRCPAIEHAGHQYAVGHTGTGGRVPLVFAGFDQPLDAAAERFGETNPDTGRTRRRSPFMLAQEALNAIDASLWAIVSNGLTLRILRDNASLTRPAYVEVDLEALFTEELLADFSAFWLLAHASRFGAAETPPSDCPWERWRAAGQLAGVTVRGKLRYQVADALRALGTGFLSHPANGDLRAALQDPQRGYDRQAFFEELLRLVYRFIFLATVEDRRDRGTGERLIFAPDAAEEAKTRYMSGYSLTWLRERAVRRSQHDRHADLWQALTITFGSLGIGQPALGLPALSGLFDADQCARLDAAQLDNRSLLAAVFQLGWFRAEGGLSRVNYRDMGPEELGSVYESLLELVPDLQGLASPATARLAFVGDDESDASTKGNTRKLTGSYYTPDSLVQELIKSALEPVISEAVRASPQRPVEALLALTVCDPACGSGHFLLSAGRRLADEVALHRAAAERDGGAPTPADYRHALRDVVGHCLYGIDKNPMAIQLAKTALWLEAYSPDRPLSFLDHHLRVGDALLGVLDPKVLEDGIPEEAFTALSGDDKAVASALKKQNKSDLKSWRQIASGDLLSRAGLAARAMDVEVLDDDTPETLAAKRQAWAKSIADAEHSTFARLADTYVSAFLVPKSPENRDIVPLSGYLWGVLNNQSANAEIDEATQLLCRRHGVFHWWLAFPQIAAGGGFSAMLGNPPWERIKLQEDEFFATRSPLVAAAKTKAERAQRIKWLSEGTLLHRVNPDQERAEGLAPPNTAEVALHASFISARRGAEAASLYAHDSKRYPLTGVGDVNTYALFSETFLQAVAPSGRAGFIVPTGIATDDSTKAYFENVAVGGFLRSLLCLENEEFVFPSVHHAFRFALLTLGGKPSPEPATLAFFARQPTQIHDSRRRFQLTPDEFALLNPNTRTCPVFRSGQDAELTKRLYRLAPVCVRESEAAASTDIARPDVNPWGIRFQAMMHMGNDSVLFRESSTDAIGRPRLPLYEAKMIHQYDHRWATYTDSASDAGELETVDTSELQKADVNFSVRPRFWVDEREVLARIARVPSRVSRAWVALGTERNRESDAAARHMQSGISEILLALAQWTASELFHRLAGPMPTMAGWSPSQAHSHVSPTEAMLQARYPILWNLLRADGLTTKKALTEFPKWALQNADVRLTDDELAELDESLDASEPDPSVCALIDGWMDRRSPRWLVGWRKITGVEKVRTVIAGVIPRAAVGDSMLLAFLDASPTHCAAFYGSWCSLVFDYVARQKVGGTNLTLGYVKQFPTLPPEAYSQAHLDFIVPRVLELTYTANDLKHWADDLAAYDFRPAADKGKPFPWNPERRSQIRAELDAYYARLYGLTRHELCYVLDPKDVMGADYPSESFRVLKESETRAFGEYRTRRMVLAAWDEQAAQSTSSQTVSGSFTEQGMIRSIEEGRMAGLVMEMVATRDESSTLVEMQSAIAGLTSSAHYLGPADASRFESLLSALGVADLAPLLNRLLPIVQRLVGVDVLSRFTRGGEVFYTRGAGVPPGDVIRLPEHPEIARLLWLAESRRMAQHAEKDGAVSGNPKATGTQ
ncbi:Eco57I restriction-modification methylase domain-containing protein [Scleromatobacter humisilvae]|uniref:site-specific DNA-methyltransferase (adenine-specific) n=1 Tax=Scleromatobacter humisilvae TaxID=2897159 RepID=A0A9X2C195_9BURK|nr:N-6 DNA methylase [Scleromatobacter humisilvae]MCK9687346.1 N-6 DNA methylase [Scleromatobacter humisilvae]